MKLLVETKDAVGEWEHKVAYHHLGAVHFLNGIRKSYRGAFINKDHEAYLMAWIDGVQEAVVTKQYSEDGLQGQHIEIDGCEFSISVIPSKAKHAA